MEREEIQRGRDAFKRAQAMVDEQRDAAKQLLNVLLRPGQIIYTVVRHRTASGKRHSISLLIPDRNGIEQPFINDITWAVRRALGAQFDSKNGGIMVHTRTCPGIDPGQELVAMLSKLLQHDLRHQAL